jgi:hypothetical protein
LYASATAASGVSTKGHALDQIQPHAACCGCNSRSRVAVDGQFEIAAARLSTMALIGQGPDQRAVDELADHVQHRVAAIARRLRQAGVAPRSGAIA